MLERGYRVANTVVYGVADKGRLSQKSKVAGRNGGNPTGHLSPSTRLNPNIAGSALMKPV